MNKNIIIVSLVFVLGIAGGILITQSGNDSSPQDNEISENQASPTSQSEPANSKVKALVNYKLPQGLVEASCPDNDTVYFVTDNNKVDCSSSPDNSITLSVDDQDIVDCNELQGRTEVRKHICVSLFINDQRSLKATTEYLASSSFGKDITSQEYYIDTGNGVVKAQYLYTGDGNELQAFEDLINSIRAT